MEHRGPDDEGLWVCQDGSVVLGHRRLSIVDLSAAGRQPMTDREGTLQIVFNGEIYNYLDLRSHLIADGFRFRTNTDTEVILAAYRKWDLDCVSHLNGMFAFAIYDSASQRLLLARDRAGEKPLFYRQADSEFMFASELKALMADPAMPRELDFRAFGYYLAFGYVPDGMCILKGVQKLPPAHAMTYDIETATLRTWQYWRLPDPPPAAYAPREGELLEELDALLRNAVRGQLVADVPIGISLSGGIDSGLVAAIAAAVNSKPVRTFTVAFPGHPAYDEGSQALLTARHCGTEHHELSCDDACAEDLLPELARQFDEPLGDSSIVPTYLIARLIRKHATVALGGDGGDELFAGYNYYGWLQMQKRLQPLIPDKVGAGLANLASGLPVGFSGRNYLTSWMGDSSRCITSVKMYLDDRSRRKLVASPAALEALGTSCPEVYKSRFIGSGNALRQATAVDFMLNLPGDLLVKVDRASMLNSLEVRAPFLDYRIIEFAFSRVPDRLRATLCQRKVLLRRLAKRFLPKSCRLQPKRGFSMPLSQQVSGPWGAYVRAVLDECDPTLFNKQALRELFAAARPGRSTAERLFALTMFELWRREYRVSF